MTVEMTSQPMSEQQTRFGWSADAVRAAERATGELLTNGTLMRRAAHAVAERILGVLRECAPDSDQTSSTARVVVLVGPGNNGGDALFAAAELAQDGVDVAVVKCADRIHDAGLEAVRAVGIRVLSLQDADLLETVLAGTIIVDGILGIGAHAQADSPWQGLLGALPPAATVLAVDCPTPGVRADLTMTFGAPKTSLLLDPDACGCVEVADIGLPADALGAPEAYVYPPRLFAAAYRVPGREDRKYTRGVVGFATGSAAYPGAAVLGTLAALSVGTGMVRYLGPDRPSDAVLAAAPETVLGEGRVQAWVVGSGIDGPGEREANSERYQSAMKALQSSEPAVVDAGALTWLEPGVRPSGSVTVMTPHAGELASLLNARGVDVERADIEADPLTWARRAGEETGFTVLLKGGVSVVHDPRESSVCIENRAPAWLATAGTGDVLAGVVGALLAAGLEPQMAASLAAYLHGQAAREANPGGPVRALAVAHQLSASVAQLLKLR